MEEVNSAAYAIVNEVLVQVCATPSYSGRSISTVYNGETGGCDIYCKPGCLSCSVAYDFCSDCQQGYMWNSDYSCIPVIVPLEITTLVFMLIGTIMLGIIYANNRS